MCTISALVLALAATAGTTVWSDERSWTVVPLPIFFYMPETSFGGGAACLVPHTPADARLRAFQAGGLYTAKDQLALFASAECYLADDDLRLTGAATYSRFPSIFFGVGPDADLHESITPAASRAEAAAGWQLLAVQAEYRFSIV